MNFVTGQVVGARPGAERIDSFLLSGWRFLYQSLRSRKDQQCAKAGIGAEMAQRQSAWMAHSRGVDAVG